MTQVAIPQFVNHTPAALIHQNDTQYRGLVFDRVRQVSDDSRTNYVLSDPPAFVKSGNNIYVAWKDHARDHSDSLGILFKASNDFGNIFGETIRLSNKGSYLSSPQIASSENTVYIVWEERDLQEGGFQTFLAISDDYGGAFGKKTRLSISSNEAVNPKMVAVGNKAFIVWEESSPNRKDIMFRSSSDYGKTLGKAVNISNSSKDSSAPQIADSNGAVFVVWQDDTYGNSDIFMSKLARESETFGNAINLSRDRAISTNPRLAVSGENLYVVWTSQPFSNLKDLPPARETLLKASKDNGDSFKGTLRITNNVGDSVEPNVAVAGNNVYVAWSSPNPEHFHNIFFRKSSDGGATFDRTFNLQNDLTHHSAPEMIGSGQTVYVAWDNAGTALNQSLMISYDGGNTFVSNVKFETEPRSISHPRMTIDADNIYFVWNGGEIYFASAKR